MTWPTVKIGNMSIAVFPPAELDLTGAAFGLQILSEDMYSNIVITHEEIANNQDIVDLLKCFRFKFDLLIGHMERLKQERKAA